MCPIAFPSKLEVNLGWGSICFLRSCAPDPFSTKKKKERELQILTSNSEFSDLSYFLNKHADLCHYICFVAKGLCTAQEPNLELP